MAAADVCGIAGSVDPRSVELHATVVRQLRTLDHRGPDSWGTYNSGRCVIGQTRLAVVDLVTGDPPLTSEDGAIGAVLNGEIYNFTDLRTELQQSGHILTSRGDTEVIAHLAEVLEPTELAARMDGMFAFAVYDRNRRRLVLGRDRFGKKPLHYWWGQGVFVFGSEIKAVLEHPLVPREVDQDAVAAYLAMGNVPTPHTIFCGVMSVPPGHVLVLEEGGSPRLERYWRLDLDLDPHAGEAMSFREAAGQVRTLLSEAVGRRLVSDVPLGAFLSGGIDSSAVVALMAERSDRPVQTFTIGFEDDEGYDERSYADLVARRFGTDHHEFVVRPDAVDLVERLVHHHDQPFGDATSVPTFLLSELTRKHVTVALCGDGGDEVFAGYERFTAATALSRLGRVPRAPWLMARAAGLAPSSRLGAVAGSSARRAATPLPEAFRSWVTYLPDWRLLELGVQPSRMVGTRYDEVWSESRGSPLLHRLLHLNLNTYLLDDLLPKVDRTAMAHGLEVRSPFLDTALVDAAFRMAPRHKMVGPWRKRVLKAAMADDLPHEVLHRPKRGFGMPLDRWFRHDLRPFMESRLLAPHARLSAYVDPVGVGGLWQDHLRGRSDNGYLLWLLLTLEIFLRREQDQ